MAPQLIFEGKTEASLPPLRVLKNPKFHGWLFSVSMSHWSTEDTMKEYVDKVSSCLACAACLCFCLFGFVCLWFCLLVYLRLLVAGLGSLLYRATSSPQLACRFQGVVVNRLLQCS